MKRLDVERLSRYATMGLYVEPKVILPLCDRILALEADHRAMREALHLIEPNPAAWPGYENADGEEIGTRVLAVLEGLRIKETPADAEKEATDASD